jgi:hypothetical protein
MVGKWSYVVLHFSPDYTNPTWMAAMLVPIPKSGSNVLNAICETEQKYRGIYQAKVRKYSNPGGKAPSRE